MTSAMGAEKEDREIVLLRQIADVAEALLDTKNLEASPFLGYNRGLTEAQELRQCLRDLRLLQVREPTPPAAPARATSEGVPSWLRRERASTGHLRLQANVHGRGELS